MARTTDEERRFPVGPESAKALGYDTEAIDALLPSVTESFSGVGKVNLNSVRYDVDIDFNDTVEINSEKGPLFILLAETNIVNNVIGQNIHNMVNPFDAKIVGAVVVG